MAKVPALYSLDINILEQGDSTSEIRATGPLLCFQTDEFNTLYTITQVDYITGLDTTVNAMLMHASQLLTEIGKVTKTLTCVLSFTYDTRLARYKVGYSCSCCNGSQQSLEDAASILTAAETRLNNLIDPARACQTTGALVADGTLTFEQERFFVTNGRILAWENNLPENNRDFERVPCEETMGENEDEDDKLTKTARLEFADWMNEK